MAGHPPWPDALRPEHVMQMQLALREALDVRALADPVVLYHAMIRACDRSISPDARGRPYSVEEMVTLAGLEPLQQIAVWTGADEMYVAVLGRTRWCRCLHSRYQSALANSS